MFLTFLELYIILVFVFFAGLLLCVVTFSLYHIWCRYLESLLWLAFLACVASAGALIAITEPDIFKLAHQDIEAALVVNIIWISFIVSPLAKVEDKVKYMYVVYY